MKSRLASLVFLVAAVGAPSGRPATEIKFNQAKGAKSVFSMAFEIGGAQQATVYQSKITEEIVDVKADGSWLTASYQTDHKVLVGGKVVQTSAQTITAVTTYDKQGRPLTIGGDDSTPSSYRVANLTSFLYPEGPIEVGGTWSVSIPESKEHGSRLTVVTFKLATVENQNGTQVATVEVAASEKGGEKPATVTGKFWIDLATGGVTKYDARIENMPTESGPAFNGHVSIVRQ